MLVIVQKSLRYSYLYKVNFTSLYDSENWSPNLYLGHKHVLVLSLSRIIRLMSWFKELNWSVSYGILQHCQAASPRFEFRTPYCQKCSCWPGINLLLEVAQRDRTFSFFVLPILNGELYFIFYRDKSKNIFLLTHLLFLD